MLKKDFPLAPAGDRHTHRPVRSRPQTQSAAVAGCCVATQQHDGADPAVFRHIQRVPVQLRSESRPQQVLDEAVRVLLQPGDTENHPEGRQHVAFDVTGKTGHGRFRSSLGEKGQPPFSFYSPEGDDSAVDVVTRYRRGAEDGFNL